MQPLLEELQDGAEREALERLGAPLTAAGTNEVLAALNERRVEALLVDESRAQAGVVCPACGWVGPPSAKACPAGGGPTDEVEDLREPAVELTFQQDARVLPVRCRTDELREAGGIAAILRF